MKSKKKKETYPNISYTRSNFPLYHKSRCFWKTCGDQCKGKEKYTIFIDVEIFCLCLSYSVCSNLKVSVSHISVNFWLQLKETKFTRLCSTKSMLTVNGQFPGPVLRVQKGDTAFVTVQNNGKYGVTIHW